MKFAANLVGILSIAIYYVVLSFLFGGLFLAFARVSAFFGVAPWFLAGVGLWFVLPVGVTLSIWLGHTTYRFLLRRWSHAADALDTRRG
jgi:Sec-independent protein secretion pathway component TatC